MVDIAVEIYTAVVSYSLPVAIVFEIGNIMVSTFLRVCFGGRLWFGRD